MTIAGNSDPCDLCDSQSVKTADQAGERGCDVGKKVSGRKRHAAVDCLGLILAIMITPAAVQDRDAAKGLIQFLVGMYGRSQIIWADGGYLGALVQWVKQLRPFGKLRLEIVRRCDHAKGFKVLPKRWISGRQTPLARPPAPAPVLRLATLRFVGPHPVPATGPYTP